MVNGFKLDYKIDSDERSRREARAIASAGRRRGGVSRVLLLGAFSSVDKGPGMLGGVLNVTGGSGGSVTSSAVKAGCGES